VSIKNDLFFDTATSRDFFYVFASPQFLGNFFILNQTKFVVKKDFNIVTWAAWEDIALGIGNIRGASKVTMISS
jgi:hypothetical protein